MQLIRNRALFLCSLAAAGCLATPLEKRVTTVSQTVYDDLVRYTKYSSAAYQWICPKPMGNTLVKSFSASSTDTQGYIARDDTRKEIIVAFRGSQEVEDFLIDTELIMVPLVSSGISDVGDAYAHTGFLDAYNSVASNVISSVKSQLAAHPGYTVISTGHSLGGALASLGSLSLKANFPSNTVKLYSFGQPRTGNAAYATLVEDTVGVSNIFRGVHSYDGVPTILPEALGYRHHATEYWQYQEPADAADVRICTGGEDATCSDSIVSTGINAAHVVYFGQLMSLDLTLCL